MVVCYFYLFIFYKEMALKLYDQSLERVTELKYLGLLFFDEKFTWKR